MGLFDRLFGRAKKIPYPPELATQVERGMNGLRALTSVHEGMWKISTAAWEVNQDEGTIVFTSENGLRAVAPVQIIGTYNTQDGTWLWGWDHPSVEPPLAEHAKRVFAHGEQHGFEVLTTRKLECPEDQCWELTALACDLCGAQGAYRGPAGTARVFFTFGKVRMGRAG